MGNTIGDIAVIVFAICLFVDSIQKWNRERRGPLNARILFGIAILLWAILAVISDTDRLRPRMSPQHLRLLRHITSVVSAFAIGIGVTLFLIRDIKLFNTKKKEQSDEPGQE